MKAKSEFSIFFICSDWMNFLGDPFFFMKLPTECMYDVEIHEISFANIHDCDS